MPEEGSGISHGRHAGDVVSERLTIVSLLFTFHSPDKHTSTIFSG